MNPTFSLRIRAKLHIEHRSLSTATLLAAIVASGKMTHSAVVYDVSSVLLITT